MDRLESLTDIFRNSFQSDNNNFEYALEALKSGGASLRDSVLIVATELKLSLTDADFIVFNCKVWSEMKEETHELRDRISHLLSTM